MMNALKEQLLKAGFQVKPAEAKMPSQPAAKHAQAPKPKPKTPAPRADEISLASAYSVRADTERREKEAKQRREAEVAARRKAARVRIQELIQSDAIATQGAERCRHFRYGKKIKRIYLTAAQNTAVNEANLGIVQLDGRFHLLPAQAMAEILTLGAEFVAVFDPKEPSELSNANDSNYADPRFQVPDDLVW